MSISLLRCRIYKDYFCLFIISFRSILYFAIFVSSICTLNYLIPSLNVLVTVADVGELELVAVARGVPDRGAVAWHAPRARQVLADRPGRQRARRWHLLRQPADQYVWHLLAPLASEATRSLARLMNSLRFRSVRGYHVTKHTIGVWPSLLSILVRRLWRGVHRTRSPIGLLY